MPLKILCPNCKHNLSVLSFASVEKQDEAAVTAFDLGAAHQHTVHLPAVVQCHFVAHRES